VSFPIRAGGYAVRVFSLTYVWLAASGRPWTSLMAAVDLSAAALKSSYLRVG
jgi:hypothetical protein